MTIYRKTLFFETCKRKHESKEIFNGIFHLVKTDCQWRMLPKEYSKWVLVYYDFRKWSFYEEFDLLLSNLRKIVLQDRSKQLG